MYNIWSNLRGYKVSLALHTLLTQKEYATITYTPFFHSARTVTTNKKVYSNLKIYNSSILKKEKEKREEVPESWVILQEAVFHHQKFGGNNAK